MCTYPAKAKHTNQLRISKGIVNELRVPRIEPLKACFRHSMRRARMRRWTGVSLNYSTRLMAKSMPHLGLRRGVRKAPTACTTPLTTSESIASLHVASSPMHASCLKYRVFDSKLDCSACLQRFSSLRTIDCYQSLGTAYAL